MERSGKASQQQVTFILKDNTEEAELMSQFTSFLSLVIAGIFEYFSRALYNLGSVKQVNHYFTIRVLYH